MSKMQNIRELAIVRTDDNHGPRLYIATENNPAGWNDEYDIDFQIDNSKYMVYHLVLDFCAYNLKFLKQFDQLDDAILYSQKQYYLYTRTYPSIIANFSVMGNPSSNRSIESKPEIEIELNEVSDLKEIDSNCTNFIIIINNNHFEAHSLDPSAKW